ncbi:hypothetical protein BKA61DRAFT_704980 [Leptodontidium sp. MPI-SDFR-AT-0119]|nr:hypothetical protein BKA61DRAFT_704980 [Leptodontidium sp. MPI-SDFR-AT-0119]
MPRHILVKELDIRKGQTSTAADWLNSVPGFRTSAAFFSFLRANLVLPPLTPNSNTSTPLLHPSSSQTLPPLTHSSVATIAADDGVVSTNTLSSIPPLTTITLSSGPDKVAALELVADSIAQQRQLASRAVIFHPITIAMYILVVGIVSQLIYCERSDLAFVATTSVGMTMACLILIITSRYVNLAEEFLLKFVKDQGEDDVIIGSRYSDEIIGALILSLERKGNGNNKKMKSGKLGGKGVVRAWTTGTRYRGAGVGTGMLEEAVRATREKLGNSAEVRFAAEHANSKMVLPELFNGVFRRREAKAARALVSVVERMEPGDKKR